MGSEEISISSFCSGLEQQNLLSKLPPPFVQFLRENGLDPQKIYSMNDAIPRYIRIKPGCEDSLPEIESELKCELEKVVWLSCFYAIPPQIHLASSKPYLDGKIYGMDVASGAAVVALDVLPGDHVLDLCAAPGAKLCMLSDMLGNSGSLTGVDIARHRLGACRTMLRKYSLGDRCRLFVADGTSFSILPPRCSLHTGKCAAGCQGGAENIFSQWSSKKSWKDRQKYKKAKTASPSFQFTAEPELIFYGINSGVVGTCKCHLLHLPAEHEFPMFGYDKVLVDAECTHDGSIKHIKKFEFWGWNTMDQRLLKADRTHNLQHLQLLLLTNGFKLLKAGGSLVYSTCSLTTAQNEDVVQEFLLNNPSAELQEVDPAENWPCSAGRIPATLRFDPATSQTSGLFIAKILKLAML